MAAARLLADRRRGPVFLADRRAPTSGRRAPNTSAELDPHARAGRCTSSAAAR
ncbi:hypothetical protein ACFPOI_16880 [Nonomuraea angiospora]|uniref:Uncharacterized protein n=1 Tax=Nonomuraea angiospora TaxID=46172 RepID=A0ABR9MHD0_9ACTN|nr:hypothetical protein [Nonomuraea angiospora]MBE1592313.1 hypothetical protein [Nonomuraea angiospora]